MSGTILSTDAFIEKIRTTIDEGHSLLPVIGAGFSASAGAPLIRTLEDYLRGCIYRATIPPQSGRRWNPLTDRWPSLREHYNLKTRVGGAWQQPLSNQLSAFGVDDWPPERPILEQARGAMANWLAALHFLSRIRRTDRKDSLSDDITLSAPQQEVVDRCLGHLMFNRSPSLSHTMLAILSGAIRLDLIITLNFDDLIEQAFQQTRNHLIVHELHLSEALPTLPAIADNRYLIKLHGSRRSLRADFTVDTDPSHEDLDTFARYVSVRNSHILVAGISGSERRLEAYFKAALTNPAACIFWLACTPNDLRTANSLAERIGGRDRFCITRAPDSGLFLLHLYQSLRMALPPAGNIFPSISRLPSPPSCSTRLKKSEGINSFRAQIRAEIADMVAHPQRFRHRAVVVTCPEDIRGLSSVCAQLFEDITPLGHSIWLDLNDIASTDHLFEALLETMHGRLSLTEWMPSYSAHDTTRSRSAELKRLLEISGRPWIVFLNARETPGGNWNDPQYPNGWMDATRDPHLHPNADHTDNFEDFCDLLHELTEWDASALRMTIVIVARDEHSVLCNHLANTLGLSPHVLAESAVTFVEEDVIKEVMRYSHAHSDSLRALAFMQRPRHLASLWIHERDRDKPLEWLRELERCQLARRKDGGFIWFHSRTRRKLRDGLTLSGEDQAEVHERLALWYRQVFDSSGVTAAVFESLYHLCSAAKLRPRTDADADWHSAFVFLRETAWLIQTRGFSRASRRKLLWILDIASGEQSTEALNLAQQCIEVLRALTREVGEDEEACSWHLSAAPGKDREVGERDERWTRWRAMLALQRRYYDLAKDDLKSEENPSGLEFFRRKVLDAEVRLLMLDARDRVTSNDAPTERTAVHNDIQAWLLRLERAQASPDAPLDLNHAAWCESRLRTHQAECEDSADRALGLLGQAEQALRRRPSVRFRAELARVEMQRAEVRLREAESLHFHLADNSEIKLRGLQDTLRQVYVGPVTRKSDPKVANARALLWDTLRFLDRVEPTLLERRRNARWAMRFCERKLRAISHIVALAVGDTPVPETIPFLGFEDAPDGCETIADELLGLANRMIRYDTYRLATVIDSYAAVSAGLRALRLRAGERSIVYHRLKPRQSLMRGALLAALERLARIEVPVKEFEKLYPPGKELHVFDACQAYIKAVEQRGHNVASLLSSW